MYIQRPKTEHVMIGEIPALLVTPETEGPHPTMIFYHGWNSTKERNLIRGEIFTHYGFQVLLPDAPHHGERGILKYDDEEVMAKYFFAVVMGEIEEYPTLYTYLKENTPMDEEKFFLCGHSMGAILCGALAATREEITGAIPYNGCWDWEELAKSWGVELPPEAQKALDAYNPANHKEGLQKKILLVANGEEDPTVPPLIQKAFIESLHMQEGAKAEVSLFEKTTHVITTNMMAWTLDELEKLPD